MSVGQTPRVAFSPFMGRVKFKLIEWIVLINLGLSRRVCFIGNAIFWLPSIFICFALLILLTPCTLFMSHWSGDNGEGATLLKPMSGIRDNFFFLDNVENKMFHLWGWNGNQKIQSNKERNQSSLALHLWYFTIYNLHRGAVL